MEKSSEVGYLGSCVELPYVLADAPTLPDCANRTREAIVAAVATLLEKGQRPPSPAREGKRDRQINIRVTAKERLALEEIARKSGFRSVSDYIRAAALDRAG